MNIPPNSPFAAQAPGVMPLTADPEVEPTETEEADVRKWAERIREAREFDAGARAQYAIDRSYVDGSAGRGTFEVRVPIAGTYVGILESFLYARDPTVDVLPAESAGPLRMDDARKLGKTLEPVIAGTWKNANLKRTGKKIVRSSLSVAVGWLKATWQERRGRDPLTSTKSSDLQDNQVRLERLQRELAAGECEYPEAVQAEIDQLIAGMSEFQEVVISRGMVIDFVSAEDMTIPGGNAKTEDYLDSPWLGHRMFFPIADAKEKLPRVADQLNRAACYVQVKAKPSNENVDVGAMSDFTAEDADAFRKVAGAVDSTTGGCVCVHEIWHKDANQIITIVEGLDRYGVEPYSPDPATARWYSFFRLAFIEVDGRRHPQSLPERSATQLDEYNRLRSNQREHRARALPKMGFDMRVVDKDEAEKLKRGGIGENIGLNLKGDADPSKALFPISYPAMDGSLYDTTDVRSELEMIWGIQEALSSTIRTAKTLGEAEIQQSGTEARESYKRDALEEMLTELAVYTAEVGLQKFTRADVEALAGPEAFWPRDDAQRLTIADLAMLVAVEIRAGSSGKPNTTARRQAWGALLPQLQAAVVQIGQLRGASPTEVADCLEQLVLETVERAGDRIDATRFIPKAPAPVAATADPNNPLAAPGVAAPMPGAMPALAPPQPPMEA